VWKKQDPGHNLLRFRKDEKSMINKENRFCRRSATDAVERLSKRSLTESVKAKGHILPSGRVGIGKRLFGSLRPVKEDLILGFPVIEWDSDNGDGTDPSSDTEGVEMLCRDSAKLQLLSPIATVVRPRRRSYAGAPVSRECGLVRSKTIRSHLSLLDSRNSSLYGERVPA
jgi:hypothetical protein